MELATAPRPEVIETTGKRAETEIATESAIEFGQEVLNSITIAEQRLGVDPDNIAERVYDQH